MATVDDTNLHRLEVLDVIEALIQTNVPMDNNRIKSLLDTEGHWTLLAKIIEIKREVLNE